MPPSAPHEDVLLRKLFLAALAVRQRAYAPYSNFAVGAALLGSDGKIYAGCNVENASFPAGLCAERVAVGQAISRGCTRVEALVLVTGADPPAPPCGLCLQTLAEFSDPTTPILLANPEGDSRRSELGALLPRGFSLPE